MATHVLALNAGSSSLKYALFEEDADNLRRLGRGSVEGIGTPRAHLSVAHDDDPAEEWVSEAHDHAAAFVHAVEQVERRCTAGIDAIGHRIVHGGTKFSGPARIDAPVLEDLRALVPLAPLHQPVQVRLIEAAQERFAAVPHVACFDTAIHRSLPEIAARFPFPNWLWDAGVRRYGFHGLSYESVLHQNPEFRQGRTIIAHLGNGASLTAFHDGVSVETTMGFTPTGGLMMGTRCGDLDPGVLIHLQRQHHLSADDLDRLTNHESGLKGVSGVTGDVRTLLERQDEPRARLAIDMFCYHAARHIAALAAAVSGVDRLVFTGGIGEHAAPVRASICARLGFLGVAIDPDLNEAHARIISDANARCTVHVASTDEEQIIAAHALRFVTASGQ